MKLPQSYSYVFFLVLILAVCQCKPEPIIDEEEPIVLVAEEGEELSGGQATVRDASENAFGFQAPGLEDNDELLFFVGNSFFNQNWVSAPASTTARDGLGPFFNARSCASCHFKDGRGEPLLDDSQKGHGLLLRLSVPGTSANGGPLPEPTYGFQVQDMALPYIEQEMDFEIIYEEIAGTFADGETYTLRKPNYQLTNLFYGPMASDVRVSPRIAPQMIGLGLLEAITEDDILTLADQDDSDGDGISGKANYVWDVVNDQLSLGRFGWKCDQPSVLQQTAAAFSGDLGITSFVFPDQNCVNGIDCDTIPNGGDKEIDDDDLLKTVLYSSSLAVPARRGWEDDTVLKGKYLFNKIGCDKCHTPKFITGEHPRFDAFSNQVIRPYTDMLLHDMGDGLADNFSFFRANGQEWRTPPLWGVGLFPVVNDHTFYLHDGRARNLEEAILWHGGEGLKSKERYTQLNKEDRQAIIQFLNSL